MANRLVEFRTQNNLSQKAIADLLGVSDAYISYLETEKQKITFAKYFLLLKSAINSGYETEKLVCGNLALMNLRDTLIERRNNPNLSVTQISGLEVSWFRDVNNLSLRELAKRLGLSEIKLGQYEFCGSLMPNEFKEQLFGNKEWDYSMFTTSFNKEIYRQIPDYLQMEELQLYNNVYALFEAHSDLEIEQIANNWRGNKFERDERYMALLYAYRGLRDNIIDAQEQYKQKIKDLEVQNNIIDDLLRQSEDPDTK